MLKEVRFPFQEILFYLWAQKNISTPEKNHFGFSLSLDSRQFVAVVSQYRMATTYRIEQSRAVPATPALSWSCKKSTSVSAAQTTELFLPSASFKDQPVDSYWRYKALRLVPLTSMYQYLIQFIPLQLLQVCQQCSTTTINTISMVNLFFICEAPDTFVFAVHGPSSMGAVRVQVAFPFSG